MLRYYAVVETQHFDDPQYTSPFADVLFTQNIAVCKLPVTDATRVLRNTLAGWVPGTTLWVDFPFPAFPENMGHWVEELLPVYSGLVNASWQAHVPPEGRAVHSLLFPNLRRAQIQVGAVGALGAAALGRGGAGTDPGGCSGCWRAQVGRCRQAQIQAGAVGAAFREGGGDRTSLWGASPSAHPCCQAAPSCQARATHAPAWWQPPRLPGCLAGRPLWCISAQLCPARPGSDHVPQPSPAPQSVLSGCLLPC